MKLYEFASTDLALFNPLRDRGSVKLTYGILGEAVGIYSLIYGTLLGRIICGDIKLTFHLGESLNRTENIGLYTLRDTKTVTLTDNGGLYEGTILIAYIANL